MHLLNNEADTASYVVNLRGIDENLQGMPLMKRPGYHEAILALTEVQRQSRREMNIVHIPKNQRKRLNDKLDPRIREFQEWLSTNWDFLISVVFYILVELTRVVFDLERVATTQFAG